MILRLVLLLAALMPLKSRGYTFNRSQIERMKRKRAATIARHNGEHVTSRQEQDEDDPFAEDDPFNEDFGPNDEPTDEERRQQRYEAAILRGLERDETSAFYEAVLEVGGIKTNDDLREEYRQIPNTYKRRDGLSGDEMAEYLATYYEEFGIENERDLIDFFQRDYRRAA